MNPPISRKFLLLLAGFLSIAAPFSYAAVNPACDNEHRANSATAIFPCGVILSGPDNLSASVLASMGRSAGAQLKRKFKYQNSAALLVPNARVLKTLSYLGGTRVYPDRIHQIVAPPDGKGPNKNGGGSSGTDPSQLTPAGITRIGAPSNSYKGTGIGVSITDTGIDLNNSDLTVATDTFDAFGGNGSDLHGHGTHVAGTVGAMDNNLGVIGVAPEVRLFATRVLNANGEGSDSDIIAGLEWVLARAGSISVVNMSLGRPRYAEDDENHPLRIAVKNLVSNQIAVIVAAGNSATHEVQDMVPAGYPEVIAVASSTAEKGSNRCRRASGPIESDTASYFTTDGTQVAISAPGERRENISKGCFIESEGILSLAVGSGTLRMSGTSMAAPHVTGVAALLKQKCSATPEQIRQILIDSADRKGEVPLNSPTSSYSFDGVREGILNLPGALSRCN
ncbi:S8 family serine peptidase [Sedimenticola sp.]|uniref:S8 family serine peptidase n=1 Tax=Sedimenticola sp. TaxID=1940285 RepID=UPI003D10F4F7